MRYDRGCWKCFADTWEYRYCRHMNCPKKDLVARWAREHEKKEGWDFQKPKKPHKTESRKSPLWFHEIS